MHRDSTPDEVNAEVKNKALRKEEGECFPDFGVQKEYLTRIQKELMRKETTDKLYCI